MATSTLHFFLLFLTISSLITAHSTSHHTHHTHHDSIKDACSVTRHRSLCIRSLTSLSHPEARRSMQWWTRAAVSATLAETDRVWRYLSKLSSDGAQSKKGQLARAALSDCVECFGDAARELRLSLGELRRLDRGGEFGLQMNDVETWVSAALTSQDTCHDGLDGWKGPEVGTIRSRVLNATYFTSNALALINKLASEGGSH